jgi:hypothetical protein
MRQSWVLVVTIAAALLPAAAPAVAGALPEWTTAPSVPLPDHVSAAALRDVTILAPDDVWAVGSWTDSSAHPLAVHWDGAAWSRSAIPDPLTEGDLYNLSAVDAVAPDDVWAVGSAEPDAVPSGRSPLLLHYDGTTWAATSNPPGLADVRGSLADVDLRAPDDGWAVGQMVVGGLAAQPLILRRKSGQWTPAAAPKIGSAAQLTSVFVGPGNEAWAVGSQTRGGHQAALVLRWDGESWAEVAVPDSPINVTLSSVAATSQSDVWAAGSVCATTDVTSCAAYVMHFTDGAWRVVPAASGVTLTDVVAFSPTDVWVVGQLETPAPKVRDHTEHWDGQRFTTDNTTPPVVASDGKSPSAIALAAAAGDQSSGTLWAVGWVDNPMRMPHAIHRS